MKKLVLLALLLPTLASAQTRYATTGLRLRAEPSPTATILVTIPAGAAVQVKSCEHKGADWCSVTYARTDGYVAKSFLAANAPRAKASTKAKTSTTKSPTRRASAESRGYYTGPRGGCYTYSASGRKRYVDRSYCN
jgi:uncharacterized protein YraI